MTNRDADVENGFVDTVRWGAEARQGWGELGEDH